ncbi:MAG: arginine--tRNA ligase, partial [Patescibacteria group bacterium]
MRELIKTLLGDIVRKIAPDFKGGILVEVPENKKFGDYTTNIVFALTKILEKSPPEIAKYLIDELKKQKIKDFSKIEAKNGFINFFLSEECLYHQVEEILKRKNKYGFYERTSRQAGKIQVEFISANPTGPLTIGNGRGGFYGDVLANILTSQGYRVAREYYINDRGEQILALGKSVKGEDFYKGKYISDLAKKINKNLNDAETGQKTVELILEIYIKPVIKKLGIKFDNWFSEKTLYRGDYEKALNQLMKSDFIYEKDGATWMKTSELGDSEDRVLIKKDGNETYFLSDILYHYDKFKTRKFDKVIDIWGADHHGYAPRLKAALKALNIPEENLDIIIIQLVRLTSDGKEVKISKRAGTFVTLEELISEVGLDAARFFFLMYSPNTHMDFDMALAKERSAKNPVYYVQYAH